MLRVINVTKKFTQTTAVDDISFELQPAEVLGFLGHNGAGKTTTIQMLLGLMTPTAGTISYFGKDLLSHRSEILQQVGFASTYVGLPEDLTVYENLDIYAQLYGMSSAERKKQIESMLRRFDMWQFKDTRTGELSTGQMTRVMLIKAFVHNPRIVLLDEPTASLDPEICRVIRNFIVTIQQEQDTSVLITSHNMQEVTEICDRVIVLQRGKIVASDTPEALAASVSHARVRLVISEGLERTTTYAQTNNLNYKIIEQRVVEIEVREEGIALLLAELAKLGVQYTYIEVEKPTLEDYFLSLVHQGGAR